MIRLTIHHNENVGVVALFVVFIVVLGYVWVKLGEQAANEQPSTSWRAP